MYTLRLFSDSSSYSFLSASCSLCSSSILVLMEDEAFSAAPLSRSPFSLSSDSVERKRRALASARECSSFRSLCI